MGCDLRILARVSGTPEATRSPCWSRDNEWAGRPRTRTCSDIGCPRGSGVHLVRGTKARQLPNVAWRAIAAGRDTDWSARTGTRNGPAVYRQADRAGPNLRRPGGDRDRERATVRRGAGAHARAIRGAGTADRDLGSAWRDQ